MKIKVPALGKNGAVEIVELQESLSNGVSRPPGEKEDATNQKQADTMSVESLE